jgi:hypothetical protein
MRVFLGIVNFCDAPGDLKTSYIDCSYFKVTPITELWQQVHMLCLLTYSATISFEFTAKREAGIGAFLLI